MNVKGLLAALFIMLVFLSCSSEVGKFTESKELTSPSSGITTLFIEAPKGDLDISTSNIASIVVTAKIEIAGKSQEQGKDFLEKYFEVSLEQNSSRVVLDARMLDTMFLMIKRFNGLVHLSVKVPAGIEIEVKKKDGPVYVSSISNNLSLTLINSEFKAENIKGKIKLYGRGGKAEIRTISGEVTIDHGAGDLVLDNIFGALNVKDGSGSLSVSRVTGDVSLNDGAGDITLSGISGNAVITASGSGKVDVKNITGNFVMSK